MKKKNEIFILKLGGSLLTDKNVPLSMREDVIKSSIEQIIKFNNENGLILVHGGGSFGHPVAKKFNISNGYNELIHKQILGLAETHEVMNKLNSYIINKFINKDFPALSIQPSSIFLKDSRKLLIQSMDIIETCLNLGILPVLYGDIILDKNDSFSILSGDQIILELCKKLKKYQILKVIFAIEEDGLYIEKDEGKKILTEINIKELNNIHLADFVEKIDVTGGIKGKLKAIKKICQLNVPVQIINGLKDEFILKALRNQQIICTNIQVPSKIEKSEEIRDRKLDHIKIPLEQNVQHSKNFLKYVKLIHHPLPEIDFDEIELAVNFFNKKISAPICIAAITGGHQVSKQINRILAQAAQEENIIMSVGSQRAGLVDPSLVDSFKIVRDVAPNIPIIGNIGIGQISNPKFNPDDFKTCIEMINADVMAIHFNALHELVQKKGDRSYKNFKENFKKVRESTNIPIIAKEVGSGFNQELAIMLDKLGFNGFDIGGAGGTSFAAIESFRSNFENEFSRNPAEVFREWGIPTPASLYNVRKVSEKLIIATGGLRTGVDIAKCISLGADIGGFAYKFLLTSWKDYETNSISNTLKEIQTLKNELRSCLWLMNLNDILSLKNNKSKRIVFSKLNQWINN